jgi:hypothetical protein
MAKKNALWSIVLCLGALGCEREIPIIDGGPIEGYQVEGFVVDRLNTPMRGVDVVLHFNFSYVDNGLPPSKSYFVTNPNQTIVVGVYATDGRLIKNLYSGTANTGSLTVEWDKKDGGGRDAASGLYTIRYTENNVTVHSYDEVVTGTVTARTDSTGRYSITKSNLPIEYYPVYFSSTGGNYQGNYRIVNQILLEFFSGSRVRLVYITLARNQITRYDVSF